MCMWVDYLQVGEVILFDLHALISALLDIKTFACDAFAADHPLQVESKQLTVRMARCCTVVTASIWLQ